MRLPKGKRATDRILAQCVAGFRSSCRRRGRLRSNAEDFPPIHFALAPGRTCRSIDRVAKYYFQTQKPDLATISKRLVLWFKQNEYDVESVEDDSMWLIQAKKTSTFRTLTGTNIAFTLKLYPSDTPDEFVCESSVGQWTANIAGAATTALFTGGLTLVTGALGAAWTVKLERDIVDFMESTLKFRKLRSEGESSTSIAMPPSPPPANAQKPVGVAAPNLSTPQERAKAKVAEGLRSLADAHRSGILDAEEYASKTLSLEKKIVDYTIDYVVEERSAKLSDALASGVIDQSEFNAKLAALRNMVVTEIREASLQSAKQSQIAKLRAAMDAGVLTPEECEMKIAALG
jgi:hypothetical protein